MSKVYSWRKLNEKELTRVYLDEMRRDFPPTELKPLSMILNSEADGTAHTWGVFDGETLAAYLLMVRPAGSRVSQLDYFAVLPEYRAAGLGAQLLADLPQHERGAQAILIEAECRIRRRTKLWRCGGWAFMPGAGPGTPASPSTCLMHGSAFWCWTARVPVPLRTGRPWMPGGLLPPHHQRDRVAEVRAVLLPGRNKILLSRRRSVQIMCTERLFVIFLLTDSQKVVR